MGLDPGTRRLQGQRSRPLGHGFYNLLGRRAFILNAPLYLEMKEGWETKERHVSVPYVEFSLSSVEFVSV